MKEFKKWLNYIQDEEGCEWLYAQEDSAKLAWKAALEWVLSTKYSDYDCKCDRLDKDAIEQELNDD